MRNRAWYWLLIVPLVATLWPPFYARHDPVLLGFPFFYWYQLLWVVITAVIVWIVYLATKEHRDV